MAPVALWRRRCLSWQACDLSQALTHFTFLADVTTLADGCRFVGDRQTLVARYDELPFAAIAFYGTDPARIRALVGDLVGPDEWFYCLVGEAMWPLTQAAFSVIETNDEWQMIFRGDPATLDPGDAQPLTPSDLPAMARLAEREEMMALEHNPLAQGPCYGIRREGELVAQGGTHLMLGQMAEIGNVVTARACRRRGYASSVVAALVRALAERGKTPFLHVFQTNEPAIRCYEALGFEPLRRMILARCRLNAPSHPSPEAE